MNEIRAIIEDLKPILLHSKPGIRRYASFVHQLLCRSGVHALIIARIGKMCHRLYLWPLAYVCRKVLYHWYHIDLWGQTTIGPGHWWPHPMGMVYSRHAVIGRRVKVYHNVSIISGPAGAPVIEDFVNLFAGCYIVGGIRIGRGVTVGAGTIVVADVPDYAVVVGNPARIIRYRTKEEIDIEDEVGAARSI